MAYRIRESRQPKHHFLFFPHMFGRISHNFFLNSSIHFISMMTSTLKLVIQTEVDVHDTLNKQPVKTHKSKKHVKDHNKAGRASIVPPSLDPPSKRARHEFAEGAPESPRAEHFVYLDLPRREPASLVPFTKETTKESTTVPMTAPTTMIHGTGSHTDASRLTTKADALRNMRLSRTVINHRTRTDPVSTCLPGIRVPRSWTLSRMSTPFRTSSNASLTK
jgi:hypothetical protein